MYFYIRSIPCPSLLQNRKFLVGVGMKGGTQTLEWQLQQLRRLSGKIYVGLLDGLAFPVDLYLTLHWYFYL